MTLHQPMYMTEGSYSAPRDRQLVTAIGDTGVLGSGDLAVTQRAAGANMTVDVAPGRCIIPGAVGSYLCHSDAVTSVSISAAPGAGNGRIDVIYARVQDSDISGSSDNWVIDKVTGTPASTPAVPALPSAYCIAVAHVTLTDSTTSITNGIIGNARRQSSGSSVWPYMGNLVLGAEPVTTAAETWGTLTFPVAPNRQVRLHAVADASFACGAGATNIGAELAIRTTYGSTLITPTGNLSVSPNEFLPVSITRSTGHTFTPGVGETISVLARIRSTSATASFDLGQLNALVFPA